uniref:Uncharacterized protein n=1 Tax=Bubo bubo TaxID=30461 RepID=A0A8C0F7C3_BUBBB
GETPCCEVQPLLLHPGWGSPVCRCCSCLSINGPQYLVDAKGNWVPLSHPGCHGRPLGTARCSPEPPGSSHPPVSASLALGLQAQATVPGYFSGFCRFLDIHLVRALPGHTVAVRN